MGGGGGGDGHGRLSSPDVGNSGSNGGGDDSRRLISASFNEGGRSKRGSGFPPSSCGTTIWEIRCACRLPGFAPLVGRLLRAKAPCGCVPDSELPGSAGHTQ